MSKSVLHKQKDSIISRFNQKEEYKITDGLTVGEDVFKSAKEYSDISLDLLVSNPLSKATFDVDGVENLANNIDSIGLIDSIEVEALDDGRYMINSGHSRVEAFQYLRDMYQNRLELSGDNFDKSRVDFYSYIPAHIMDSQELKHRNERLMASNFERRQNDILHAIRAVEYLSNKLAGDDKEFFDHVFGEGNLPSKFNRVKVIYGIVTDKLNISSVSEASIARFLSLKSSGDTVLLNAIKSGVVSLYEGWLWNTKYSTEDIHKLLDMVKDERKLFVEKLDLKTSKSKRPKTSEEKVNAIVKSTRNKLSKLAKNDEIVSKVEILLNEIETLLVGEE